ncbi:MAG: ATP-grasp domain-containing protein, partial [Gammaproteobacteria bacterium]|nr:ATP-grasp domain-containing protein [Gammaproteobacteria bacterium]
MENAAAAGDQLFLIAESLAQDFSLFPDQGAGEHPGMRGLLGEGDIARRCEALANMDIDSYIEAVVSGAEDVRRQAAPEVVRRLGEVSSEVRDGPFYAATVRMDFDGELRQVGFIAQDRSVKNGVWGPEHHLAAAAHIQEFSKRALPIVSLMDTPGADAEAEANRDNQAHSISRLIAEMSNVTVPNLGIVLGLGYSGGAIPLAASNMILSVRDGVFSTIQPKSLASIARRLNLSWQECAKHVGLSPCELHAQGNIDGVIDYSPGEDGAHFENFRLAIVSGIVSVEDRTKAFVADNPYILDHYRRSLERYLHPSKTLQRLQESAAMKLTRTPTEYVNVFGVAYRYLRYLACRRRIHATSSQQYGRLASQELPKGELAARADRERRRVFLKWMQDADRVRYDDGLARTWKQYGERKDALHDERGRFAQFFRGEPQKNFREARANLFGTVGMYLYNRWKSDAAGNFRELRHYLDNAADARALLRTADIPDPYPLLAAIAADGALGATLHERFTHEGKKLLASDHLDEKADAYVRTQLTAEINLALTEGSMAEAVPTAELGTRTREAMSWAPSPIVVNRLVFEERFGRFLAKREAGDGPGVDGDLTVLDILLEDDLREDFIEECRNFLLFDGVYDRIIDSLDSIAEEAERTRSLSKSTLSELVRSAFETAASGAAGDESVEALRTRFFDWFLRIDGTRGSGDFLRAVEEWKKSAFAHLSDTLFVVVTFLFEKLLVSWLNSEWDGKRYDERISPRNIGRKKDFWNRLTIAYRDLRIQNALQSFKRRRATGSSAFVEAFFTDFEELFPDLLSSDPCEFPGLRLSIEAALARETTPCGVITGVGTFQDGAGGLRVGTVISNADFQAGAFDMASAEKFCKLLVHCAEQRLPLICFISSGGMQTKEGAGALFSMAAINDRLTRFIRDHELPVIVFGYGDCTGGAQASFVTHPLVQTYYFSGTSMPFAGQIVVPSNLPSDSILSNYLWHKPGAMQGLVKHPFLPDLDDALRAIDPDIPVPEDTVVEVVRLVMAGVFDRHAPAATGARPRASEEDLVRPVSKVLVHARGCTAVKLIRVAQRWGIEVVLVQSDPDMESVPADMLGDDDALVCIGGATPDESYLNALSVLSIAEHEGVDALHPGIGFLSESSQFAALVRSHGINFVGPPVSSMETMGNKSNAISTAMRLGVPVVPGSHGIVTDADRAAEVADEIGYPVLIKAVHGGGGKGIQVVESRDRFHELFQRVSAEARAAFGNGDVYLEKYVTSLRHIEAQLLRDHAGNTRVLGLRDCSVQRDKQKVIEESASTALPEPLVKEVMKHTAAIACEVGYVGAGTVEFIYDMEAGEVYFMEMNTRLQVEHPVTEQVSGVDIVGEQFRIAAGETIDALEIGRDGYAIEARINAERVTAGAAGELQFHPSPGAITACEMPEAEHIDVISMAGEGKFVSPYYDSMIAQVIARGGDRDEAADRLAAYLDDVRIGGIATNVPLVRRVLRDPVFRAGDYDTGYLPRFLERTDAASMIEEIEAAAGD